ncbi:hypothetical protein NDU88_005048 [Pleurodeles waltl]|uniref:Uncharacterized protein n=1 Tax=Pleurodeles waltl TaxID=8319 RepID=A0AAV7W6S0_PLEWA|nr:hypothetical protein NDU88_005048 [Pleurodeles waltl]
MLGVNRRFSKAGMVMVACVASLTFPQCLVGGVVPNSTPLVWAGTEERRRSKETPLMRKMLSAGERVPQAGKRRRISAVLETIDLGLAELNIAATPAVSLLGSHVAARVADPAPPVVPGVEK